MPAFTALFIDWVITALWPIVAQSGVRLYSPLLFTEVGLIVGFLVLTPWLFREQFWEKILSSNLSLRFFWIGFFGAIPSFCYVWALKFTTPTDAGIVASVEVLYSAILCLVLLHERISLSQTLASLAVIAGTGLVFGHGLNSTRWKGDLIILLTPWMYQISHIFAKRLPKGLSPIVITGGRVFYQALTLLPFTLWVLWHGTLWSWSSHGLEILFFQAIALSCLNYIFWFKAILEIDVSKATAFLLSYPALTLFLSWILGREKIAWFQVAGLAMSLGGAIILKKLIDTEKVSSPIN